jgi:hypothetical protein
MARNKNAAWVRGGAAIQLWLAGLQRHNILGLQALGSALDGKLHALPFIQRSIAAHGDGAVVHEDIFACLCEMKP